MALIRLALSLLLVLTGFVALEIGLIAIYWPAALIVGGVLTGLAGATLISVDEGSSEEPGL